MTKIITALLGAALLIGCASAPKLTIPKDGEVVPTLKDAHKRYLAMEQEERINLFSNQTFRSKLSNSKSFPKITKLEWEGDSNCVYKVELFEGNDCIFTTNVCGLVTEVDNLKIGYDYRWSVKRGRFGKKAEGRFRTENIAPRLLRFPGIYNVRDLGGYTTLDGKRVKQGMIFRSVGLNGNASQKHYTQTELMALRKDIFDVAQNSTNNFEVWSAKKPEEMKILETKLGTKWMAFIPSEKEYESELRDFTNNYENVQTLTEIPESIFGVRGKEITIPEGEMFEICGVTPGLPAYFMQEVWANEDGFMAISVGGDFFWRISVNGKPQIDLSCAGNGRYPYAYDNYYLPIELKKGKNLFVFQISAGRGEWLWGYSNLSDLDNVKERLITDRASIYKSQMEMRFDRILCEVSKGATRLSEDGREYILKRFGIKSDIDLRSDTECYGMTGSPLGDSVNFFHYSSQQYAPVITTAHGRRAFKNVFSVFLDEKNYPIDFHCIAGQDRTGSVALILGAILGIPEDDLYKDWEATGFWNNNSRLNHNERFFKLLRALDSYPGPTLNARAENFVLSLGFTPSDLSTFRQIMLDFLTSS